jgi:hypothetical protein
MSFVFIRSLTGSTPQAESLPCAVQNNVAQVLAINSSGYVDSSSDATAATLVNLIGVTENAVDNSGGSAGDLFIDVIVTPGCVFEIGTSDTMAAAHVFKKVAVSAAGNTLVAATSAVTNSTGTVKILKFVSASKVEGEVLYIGPMT